MPDESGVNRDSVDAFLAAILQSIEVAIIAATPKGVVSLWNGGAERLLGYTAGEIVGKPVSSLIPPQFSAQEHEILKRLESGDRIQHSETQRIRRDGSLVQVAVTYSAVRDSMGEMVGVVTIARDVAELKRLEKAELDQVFLSSIVSFADDAIISKDLNGIVTSWNAAAEKLFGYTSEEMIGRPVAILIPQDHADEEPQILGRIRRGERIARYETKRVRKDGRHINVSLTVSPIRDRMGRVTGASKIVRDMSERQRWLKAEAAESFLGALVGSAEDAIISKTLEGIVTSWNEAAEKLYGYSADEMIGKPIAILIPPDHPSEEPQILERIRRGERVKHYETERVRKDGRRIHVALTVSPIKDGLGNIIGASKISRDITEQRRASIREREALQQAQQARRQAEEASRTKDEFLATVSHELRTPMTAILGWSRILMTGQLQPELQQRAVETIERNARSQAQLIEDLLDISRIVTGKLRVDFKPVDLAAVVGAAVEAVRPAADAKNVKIQTSLDSSAGSIVGDFERLQQVVWNLLSNAIRFTGAKGLVQIDLRRVESQVELRVSDNGIGIKPEFLPWIFGRFTQADSSITRSQGGLGMGLAIVKSLVELHGGVVSAASPGEGQGAVFVVKLPISEVRHGQNRPQASPRASLRRVPRHPELMGIKILVVDDEPDTCDMLTFILSEVGAVVQTAESAQAALQIFDRWAPDILVADISMPHVDGYEFIRLIRKERQSGIPAVALTAMARIDDRIKALRAGFQMHVSKPVEPAELISIVASLVGLINRSPVR